MTDNRPPRGPLAPDQCPECDYPLWIRGGHCEECDRLDALDAEMNDALWRIVTGEEDDD